MKHTPSSPEGLFLNLLGPWALRFAAVAGPCTGFSTHKVQLSGMAEGQGQVGVGGQEWQGNSASVPRRASLRAGSRSKPGPGSDV